MPTNVSASDQSALFAQIKALHDEAQKNNTSVKSSDIKALADQFQKAGYDISTGGLQTDLRVLFDQSPDQLNKGINGGKTTGAIGDQWDRAINDLVVQLNNPTPTTPAASPSGSAATAAAGTAATSAGNPAPTDIATLREQYPTLSKYESAFKVVNDKLGKTLTSNPPASQDTIKQAIADCYAAYNDDAGDNKSKRNWGDFQRHLGEQFAKMTDPTAVKDLTDWTNNYFKSDPAAFPGYQKDMNPPVLDSELPTPGI